MRIPTSNDYYETRAVEEVTRLAWRREYRQRRKEHKAPGPCTRYLPQGGGVFLVVTFDYENPQYVRRDDAGNWVPVTPRPLLQPV